MVILLRPKFKNDLTPQLLKSHFLTTNTNSMKKVLTVLSFMALISYSGYGQAGSEYEATLKTMFEVSGSEQSYQAATKQIFKTFKQQYAHLGAETLDDLEKEFTETSLDDLTAMLAPVYVKYLTQEDLEGLIAFYRTPLGKKFAKNTPFIMQESMQVGQQWGMKIGQDFKEKLSAKGY